MAYATRAQFFRYAMPRGLASVPERDVASVDLTADTLTTAGHGFVADLPVEVVKIDDDTTLPTPLAEATTYYVIEVSDDRFSLTTSAGGVAISLLVTNTGPFAVKESINAIIDDALEYQSRRVDDMLKAHLVPMPAPVPVVLTAAVCKLAAPSVLRMLGRDVASLEQEAGIARGDVERWAKNAPVRDANASGTANDAEEWGDDLRGWSLGDSRVM